VGIDSGKSLLHSPRSSETKIERKSPLKSLLKGNTDSKVSRRLTLRTDEGPKAEAGIVKESPTKGVTTEKEKPKKVAQKQIQETEGSSKTTAKNTKEMRIDEPLKKESNGSDEISTAKTVGKSSKTKANPDKGKSSYF
jgi:hypothetical protein